jgi:hypothetical protein
LGVFFDYDQVAKFAGVLVRELFRVGEESDDVADEFFGLLQLRLWQRTRRGRFERRETFAEADSLSPA